MPRRIVAESTLALVAGVLAVVTAINAEWIEWLTGADPDGGSGALEWGVVVILALGAVVSGVLARRDLLRWRAATA
ncbi:hypothetical protein [Pengzhenrongella phosphoraccumulans]|uniref:hypothetical protein n=1 Tax=Pengzhenrongella phosphoraccumulans TaxID=3114394 RepID=UPI00388FFB0D